MLRKLKIAIFISVAVLVCATLVYQSKPSLPAQVGSGDNCYVQVGPGESCPDGTWSLVGGIDADTGNCADPIGCGCYADNSHTCTCLSGQTGYCSAGTCTCDIATIEETICYTCNTITGSCDGITRQYGCGPNETADPNVCESNCNAAPAQTETTCWKCDSSVGQCFDILRTSGCLAGESADQNACNDGCFGPTLGPVCGNNIPEEGEECDDGNTKDGDGCSSSCTKEAVCGNGVLEEGEECDSGQFVGGGGCTYSCTCPALTEPDGNGGCKCIKGTDAFGNCAECLTSEECNSGDSNATPCNGMICQDGQCVDGDQCLRRSNPDGCLNQCVVVEYGLDGESLPWSYRCERDYSREECRCPESFDYCGGDGSDGNPQCCPSIDYCEQSTVDDHWFCKSGIIDAGPGPTAGTTGGGDIGGLGGVSGGTSGDTGTTGGTGDSGDTTVTKKVTCVSGTQCSNNQCVVIKQCTSGKPMNLSNQCSPGGCGETSSSAGSSSSGEQYVCCGGSCITLGTDFDGICASPVYSQGSCEEVCGSNETHTVCAEDTCTEVAGAGEDGCKADADCVSETHGVCHGTTCAQEPGGGKDLCDEDADCTNEQHLACKDDSCTMVQGPGKDLCDEVLGCGTDSHMTCDNYTCAIVDGGGANECNGNIGCNQHTECRNLACRIVSGPGKNECAKAADCQLSSSASSATSGFYSSQFYSYTSSVGSVQSGTSGSSSSLSFEYSSFAYSSFITEGSTSSAENIANATSSIDFTLPSSFSAGSLVSATTSSQGTIIAGTSSIPVIGAISSQVSSRTLVAVASSHAGANGSNGTTNPKLVTPNPACGNGFLNNGEDCDDGNQVSGDGCSAACILENADPISCSSNEECGSGACANGVCLCTSDSECGADSCVGGVCAISIQRQLDKNNIRLVAAASMCGNGVLESGEECDDSNRRDDDGCNSSCLLEVGVCGDGVVQTLLDEQCEPSLHDSTLPYSCVECRFQSKLCGDAKVDPGEECDNGALNSTSPDADCRPDCSISRCGDGILDSTELCDDGNRAAGDGCSRYCTIEDSDKTGVTVIAAENIDFGSENSSLPYTLSFPQFPNNQAIPYQLPLAQLQPLIQGQAPIGDTGPAAVAVVGAGAAAGMSWIRRKKKR